jgi:serine protease Do
MRWTLCLGKMGRGATCSFAVVLALLTAGLTAWTPAAVAVDVADTAATTSAAAAAGSISQSLRYILDGNLDARVSIGVTDLRAMQGHVSKLSAQVKKCTVGVQVGPAWGSGVIISKDGYVLTAAHVAGRPNREKCKFTLDDGRTVEGKTLGLFRTLDAGLMKITDAGEYPFAELGNSSKLKEGQWCIAMGHPGGYQEDRGLVLRLGQILLLNEDAITTNCTLVGGDSGGPLFDMDGRVIGINSRIAEQLYNNMHVPVNAYNDRGAWDRMLKGDAWGRLPGQDPAWLGVGGDAEAKNAKISTVTPKSPAEHYGLQPGDVVIAFDGREIKDFGALKQAVADCHADESIMLRIRRGEELKDLRLRLWKKSE